MNAASRGGPGGWWILHAPEIHFAVKGPLVPVLAGWRLERGERVEVWNLEEVARLAPEDPTWRDGVRALARKVLNAAGNASSPHPGDAASAGLEVRLRPSSRVPEELRTGEYAAERIVGDLWAIYGDSRGERFEVAAWTDVGEREHARSIGAAMTLGGAFAPRDILSPIEDGLPIFTNAESHPNVAAALLMPNNWWTMIMGAFDPRPATVLVAIPAPSRIFVSFDDAPPFIAAMHQLIAASGEIEEDLLSDEVYRFDGNTWTVAEGPVDAP